LIWTWAAVLAAVGHWSGLTQNETEPGTDMSTFPAGGQVRDAPAALAACPKRPGACSREDPTGVTLLGVEGAAEIEAAPLALWKSA
jgi:hypothetical protein